MSESRLSAVAGRLQWWLQGHPAAPSWRPRSRPWPLVTLGNLVSDLRYRAWRINEDKLMAEGYKEMADEMREFSEFTIAGTTSIPFDANTASNMDRA